MCLVSPLPQEVRFKALSEAQDGKSVCRICHNQAGNILHIAREMFFGRREQFTYLECAACGTLQLQDVPDLRPYYGPAYYSLQPVAAATGASQPTLRKRLTQRGGAAIRRSVAGYYCRPRTSLGAARHSMGKLLAERMSHMAVGFPDYLKETQLDLRLKKNSSILDVGSGAGETLVTLCQFGFRNLTGVDPFLDESLTYANGIRVLKAELAELTGHFDLILANHSVEHVPDPRATLREIYRLLKADHYAIIRIPVVANAWQRYRTDWVQLDPPRHLFLFPVAAFAALARSVGFALAEVRYDSTAFQFWGSEQYARDIPLLDERSYYVHPETSLFTAAQIADFATQAAQLNAAGAGDQAVFYLRKI